MLRVFVLVFPVFILAGCGQPGDGEQVRFVFPDGDPTAGRTAFTEMQCYACHAVEGDDFPDPHASPPVPVALGPEVASMDRGYLAESIISPSHRIPEDMEGIRHEELSRMGDYSEAMTVRQLIDIVAYLESLAGR